MAVLDKVEGLGSFLVSLACLIGSPFAECSVLILFDLCDNGIYSSDSRIDFLSFFTDVVA